MTLQKRVEIWLNNEGLAARPFLPPSSKLVISVSGGPDSLALLHVLAAIFPLEYLVVVHLNHGWRAEAETEAEFVRATAVSLHIPCYIEKTDVIGLARAEGLSLEEAGRNARYAFFARVARQVGANAIAVGHHADDQAETVLMHLLRGAGLAGLRGMLPVSPLPDADDLWLIRPFLTTTRAEIEQYCREHALNPVIDPSNRDTTYFRNRLRHELLPILADYNPQIKARLQRMAAVAAADFALLDGLTQEKLGEILLETGADWLALDRSKWLALPLSLRRAVLRQVVKRLRADLRDVNFQPIEQARLAAEKGKTGVQAALPGGVMLTVEYERLTIAADPDALPIHWPQMVGDTAVSTALSAGVPLPIPGCIQLANGWTLTAEPVPSIDLSQIQNNPDPWTAFVDVGGADLWVRGRLAGERIRPLGMSGQSAKLKEVMINRKIPARLRAGWPIVATTAHPVWLVGHLLDERGRVTAVSPAVIRLHCEK